MGTGSTFHVDSEVGRLRRVLLHRPDLELQRLTPSNTEEFLYDDVLWASRARQEHGAFADTLVEHGVEALYLSDLLAETIKQPAAKDWVLERVADVDHLGIGLALATRSFLESLVPPTLVRHLIGG